MTGEEFGRQLKGRALSGLYLFYGPEEYAKQRALSALREALLPAGLEALNESILENPTAAQIYESALAVPFMCDQRLVVAKDPAFLLKAKDAKPDENASEQQDPEDPAQPSQESAPEPAEAQSAQNAESGNEALKIMRQLLNDSLPSCVIVLYIRADAIEDSALSKKTLFRNIDEKNRTVSFGQLTPSQLQKLLESESKKRGCELSREAFEELTDYAGLLVEPLLLELDKLCSYRGSGLITPEDVHTALTPNIESGIFKLIDAFIDRKTSLGYLILERMLEANEPVPRISFMILRQIRLMAHIKSLTLNGISVPEITRVLSLTSDRQVKNPQRQCASLDFTKLADAYQRAVRLQALARTGRLSERNALDEILLVLQTLK